MVLLVSDEVRRKNGGPRMVVIGIAGEMVECRWYDGHVVQREAFREDELVRGEGQHSQHN
ncbi:TPA: YodC family protein [Klebsiella aerogenes]